MQIETRSYQLIIKFLILLICVVVLTSCYEQGETSTQLNDISDLSFSDSFISEQVENTSYEVEHSDVFCESSYNSQEVEESTQEQESFHGWIINEFGYTYVYNACGYEQFNYKATALNRYVNALNTFRAVLPNDIRLFNITVPVSSTFAEIPREIYTNDNFYNQSQSAFVNTISTMTVEGIINVPIVDEMESCYDNGDYVYFRTDKNWTSLGAYNAYLKFCEQSGIVPHPLSNHKIIEIGNFLGSFYNATLLPEMSDFPDEFVCYSTLPTVNTTMTVFDNGIQYSNYSLCMNNVGERNAYDVYLGQSAERYEICTNSSGGSLLIISDSSAYPLIPFLASHYSKIDVIDPRKFTSDLSEYLSNHRYDDCIIVCYSTNAISGEFIPKLNIFTGEEINE